VALASLYVSTKEHDTLKKPRELLAVSYSVRFPELAAKSKHPGGEVDLDTMDQVVGVFYLYNNWTFEDSCEDRLWKTIDNGCWLLNDSSWRPSVSILQRVCLSHMSSSSENNSKVRRPFFNWLDSEGFEQHRKSWSKWPGGLLSTGTFNSFIM
jgi:hypothetical protein